MKKLIKKYFRIKNSANIVLLFLLLSSVLCPLSSVLGAQSVYVIQSNFTGGEFSPLMASRTDMSKYMSGCNTLENFVIYPHGPATKRPGFKYIAEIKDSSNRARLIPFEYSTEQAYILEFGESGDTGYMRVYMNQGRVLWTTGGTPYEIATPYLSAALPDLQYCQSADVLYLTHQEHPIRKLTRTAHTAWTLADVTLTDGGDTNELNDDASGDYPCTCTFHENRLAFSGTTSQPNTIWLSKTGSFEDFTVGVLDDDAMEIALASDQVNAIQWLVSSTYLTLGTTAGEWRISATDPDYPITPTDITAKRELVYGSCNRKAVHVGKDILFIQRQRRKVRQLNYQWQNAGYIAPDLTVLAEHITAGGVSEIAFQQEPFSILWGIRNDGDLLGLTYLPEHEVYAWHHHSTQGEFESIATIPAGNQNDLYAIIQREINSAVSRFVEVMADPFTSSELKDAYYVDSGIAYNGTSTTTLTGATHLRLTPVVALADGRIESGLTVDATGGVTISQEAEEVVIGLPYTATLETLRIEVPADRGTSQGRVKRISEAILRLYKTHIFSIGPDEDTLIEHKTGVSLYTGDYPAKITGGSEREGRIVTQDANPTPLTIRGIVSKVSVGD